MTGLYNDLLVEHWSFGWLWVFFGVGAFYSGGIGVLVGRWRGREAFGFFMGLMPDARRKCPECRGPVPYEARRCRHCASEIPAFAPRENRRVI